MRKVTTINLSGRAFQLDDTAYKAVNEYLDDAKKILANDPDQAEILADLELSIADKCQSSMHGSKDVVSEAEMSTILAQLGKVETDDSKTDRPQKDDETPKRRLFQVREGAVFLGVCKGLAAYLNMDVVIVRVVFVVLTLLTHGIWILAYIVAALLLPTADSPEEVAAAYGEPTTAQEVIDRVRRRATNPATLDAVGSAVTRVTRAICKIAAACFLIAALLITAAWGVGLWAIGLGRITLHGSLAHYNGWPQWLALTALYLTLTIPLLILFRLLSRAGKGQSASRSALATEVSLGGLWLAGLVTVVSLVAFSAGDFKSYVNNHHGYLDINSSHLCVDDSQCHPDHTQKVRSSFEVPALPDPVLR